jgi:hypothetical protein
MRITQKSRRHEKKLGITPKKQNLTGNPNPVLELMYDEYTMSKLGKTVYVCGRRLNKESVWKEGEPIIHENNMEDAEFYVDSESGFLFKNGACSKKLHSKL